MAVLLATPAVFFSAKVRRARVGAVARPARDQAERSARGLM